MTSVMQYVIIGVLGVIAITTFPTATVVVLGIVVLLWLIRLIADLFWWMKDRGKL